MRTPTGSSELVWTLLLAMICCANVEAETYYEISRRRRPYTIQDEARDFPNSERLSNQDSLRLRRRGNDRGGPTLREMVRDFPNSQRPDNRTLLDQRRAQSRD
jgi:hypothetical protein